VAVPESDVGAIADGATVEFRVRTWPGVKFSGVIRRIAHAVDQRTRTMPIELDVVNRDGKLAPGLFTEVAWPVRRAEPSLFVPASAVVQATDKTFIDRIKDGEVEQVAVQRGAVVKDSVEVFGPLQAGDLVLKRGSEELKNGAKVNARRATGEEHGSGAK
jgi:RND family efflux transporter MFP subunit